mmetsp:Transcript_134356/g.429269  ORF Transcript_134356/g.429269 Transcript_134356/m.429269 type:complete len:349 (-) Transcript_134356:2-1048(-)
MAVGRRAIQAEVTAGVGGLGLIALLHRDGVVVREGAHGPLRQLGVRDVDADEDHALGGEVVQHEAPDGLRREVGHGALARVGAEAEGVVAEGGLVEQVADHRVGVGLQLLLAHLDLLLHGLHLPRQQTREEHVANHERHDQGHEFARDVHAVDDLLAAGLAARGAVRAKLLEGLDGAEVAQVGGRGVGHHGHHVGDAKVRAGLEAAARGDVQTEAGREAGLVDGDDLEAVLEHGEFGLRRCDNGRGGVQEDGPVQSAVLVGVGDGLAHLVKVECGELHHDLLHILLLELHRREGRDGQGACAAGRGESDRLEAASVARGSHHCPEERLEADGKRQRWARTHGSCTRQA